jgi:predicted regulator of Ras-like GTPase activity (Roadblock/LC7/MglB family)
MANIKQILNNLMQADGIVKAVMVGRDGFVIESTGESTIDEEAIAALVTTAFSNHENIGKELNVGRAKQIMIEFERSVIMAVSIGEEAILAVVTGANASLGSMRFQVKRFSRELEACA